jgi:leucyl aminopeptidase
MDYQLNFNLPLNISISTGNWQNVSADSLVFLLAESETAPEIITENLSITNIIKKLYTQKVFTGKNETIQVIPCAELSDYNTVILLGLGDSSVFNAEKQRRIGGFLAKKIKELKSKIINIVLPTEIAKTQLIQELAVGLNLATYKFADFKSVKVETETIKVNFCGIENKSDAEKAIFRAESIIQGVNLARTLVNLPPNYCTPEFMAAAARKAGEIAQLKVSVLDKPAIEAEKMHAFLAVNYGSHHPPQFIIMEHEGEKSEIQETIVLIGKAVTFDTGGYNIKTGDGMATMKTDMAGGAAVLGAMLTIGKLKPCTRVIGLVPATENKISENAYLPQDVITASNGKTIEIISTDAEGRMTLADALVYADRFGPVAVIDIATLTGACVTALGGVAAGLFSNDDSLKDQLLAAADSTNEKLWHLPMYEEYQKQIDSPVADLKNSGGKMGGVGSSALFLKHFTNYSWAHIDMAGVAGDVAEKPYNLPRSASGYGVRLFVDFVLNRK